LTSQDNGTSLRPFLSARGDILFFVSQRIIHSREPEKVEAHTMTDKQWDELIELFEVVKYDADKDDLKRRLENDIHRGSNKYRK